MTSAIDKWAKRYWVEMETPDGITRKVVVSGKSLIESFRVDAEKIMFEMRVTDILAFNQMQKLIGIRQTDIQQTLYTSEINDLDIWFQDADNLMFFINKYARNHTAYLGTRLKVVVSLAKPEDFNGSTIDYPIDRFKFDFEKMQPRIVANQNLHQFLHFFYHYVNTMKADWKTVKYSNNIAENLANKLMELGYLDEDYQIADKFFDEFTSEAYNDNEKNYKEIVRSMTKIFKNKSLLVKNKVVIAKLLFDIGVERELIDPIKSQLTDKALKYIKENS